MPLPLTQGSLSCIQRQHPEVGTYSLVGLTLYTVTHKCTTCIIAIQSTNLTPTLRTATSTRKEVHTFRMSNRRIGYVSRHLATTPSTYEVENAVSGHWVTETSNRFFGDWVKSDDDVFKTFYGAKRHHSKKLDRSSKRHFDDIVAGSRFPAKKLRHHGGR